MPTTSRLIRLFALLLLAFLAAACAAPTAPAADAAPDVPASPTAPVVEAPPVGASGVPVIETACKVDSDCVVKDVGNCCGTFPACVHRDSPADPQAVMAECQRTGMASVCGFREIQACACVASRCEAVDTAAPVAR